MMESLVPDLEEWGVNSDDIYYESFGAASLIKPKKAESKISLTPVNVSFSQSGKGILWDPNADSLLEFAEANNIEVDSACRSGSCGTCQTRLQAGSVDYNQQPDVDVETGHCLLCISTPKNDLVLDA